MKNIRNSTKTLLAIAMAAGFSCTAYAQTQMSSSITLYGVLDVGVRHITYKNKNTGVKAKITGMSDGVEQGARFGLRGSEDLGGGLKAQYAIENGFAVLTGAGSPASTGAGMFTRQAWLGLANDNWGQVAFGRQYNMAALMGIGFIVTPYSDAYEAAHAGAVFTSLRTVRYDNMVTYRTPVMSGFQFGAGYTLNRGGNQSFKIDGLPKPADVKVTTLGLTYREGPLQLAVTYDHADMPFSKDITAFVVGGNYNFGPVRLYAAYGQDRSGVFDALGRGARGVAPLLPHFSRYAPFAVFANSDSYKTNNYSVGLSVPLGSDNVVGVAVDTSRLSSGAFKTARVAALGKTHQDRVNVYYTHKISPRTQLYAFATHGRGFAFDNVTSMQFMTGFGHRF